METTARANFVKGIKPEAVEAGAEVKPSKEINQQILAELSRIRKSLEKKTHVLEHNKVAFNILQRALLIEIALRKIARYH